MMLHALLASDDDQTAKTLIETLTQFGVVVTRSNPSIGADARSIDDDFDQVIADFDDPKTASLILETCRQLARSGQNPPVTVAVLSDPGQIRAILGAGAHFILTKPLSAAQSQTTLLAASTFLKRTRRQASVAVQEPVAIQLEDGTDVEGILLELSAGGMEVLAARPLSRASSAHVSFQLSNGALQVEAKARVAWSIANGQTGLRFLQIGEDLRRNLDEWLTSHSQDEALEESDMACPCKVTDLSLGACYVQTESPFPQSSKVDLCLRAGATHIQTEGLVRIMHPGRGMGIEFPQSTAAQRSSVGEFIDYLASHPGTEPRVEASPRSLVAGTMNSSENAIADNEGTDPLLELLRTGGEMEEEAFLAELANQRTPADVVS